MNPENEAAQGAIKFYVLAFPLCKAKASLANVQEPTEDKESRICLTVRLIRSKLPFPPAGIHSDFK